MTILKRLQDIARGKCTGISPEEAETFFEAVDMLGFVIDMVDTFHLTAVEDKKTWKRLKEGARDALDKLEADDDSQT